MTLNKILSESTYANVLTSHSFIPENGIVFLYPCWSSDYSNLITLLKYLEKTQLSVQLIIYDIDKPEFLEFSKKYKIISHGKGEMYYIRNGIILYKLIEFATEKRIAAFVQNIEAEVINN